MKTSNKLILAALAVLLMGLAFYNNALRAEYRTGTFRDPLKNFVTIPVKAFDRLDLKSASLAGVRIEPGPYGVRVHKQAAEALQVQQQGQQLTLGFRFAGSARPFLISSNHPAIIVTCPSLAALRTDASYSADGKVTIDHAQTFGYNFSIAVRNFRQDSLLVEAENGSHIDLLGNTLGRLRVTAGHTEGSPIVRVHLGNHIQQAKFRMGGKSKLVFDELAIPELAYQFADSATTTLPGRSLSVLLPRNNRLE